MQVMIEIDKIDVNPKNPRKSFNIEQLQELKDSIQNYGVIQPILLTELAQGRYQLIAGERRLRACRELALQKVPAYIKSVERKNWLTLALVENIQRASLNPIEEAKAFNELIHEHGYSIEECAKQVGKDRSSISNLLRILQLPQSVQDYVIKGQLSLGHAKVLLSISDPLEIMSASKWVVSKELSVKATTHYVASILKKQKEKVSNLDQDLEYTASKMRDHFKTKVKIAGNNQKGKIEISYFTPKDLDRIMDMLFISK